MFSKQLSKYKDWAPVVLRIILGIAFILHGWPKWQNIDGVIGFFATLGLPAFFAYIVAFVELAGGIAILLGIFTRYAAALIAIVMIGATILVKSKIGFIAQGTCGAELDLSFLAIALALVILGSGKLSLEKALFKKEW